MKLRLRVSEKIRVPTTNATPSTIANVLISSRTLRASRLLRAARITGRCRARSASSVIRAMISSTPLAVGLAQLVDDPAVGEEDDPVGVGRGDRVVGDHHDGLAVGVDGVAEQLQHLGARPGVEVAGGLVGEDDARAAHQRPGDRHALLLAAGELVGLVARAGRARPTVAITWSNHAWSGLRAGDGQRERDVLLGGQRRHQVERLEDEADLVAAQQGELLVVHRPDRGLADAAPRPTSPGRGPRTRA